MPMTRAPFCLAIWPAIEPTAPGGGRDDHGLAGLRVEHVGDPGPGGQAGHAQHAEVGGQGQAREAVHRPQPVLGHDRVFGPAAGQGGDHIARLEARPAAFLDHAQGQAAHDAAQRHRRQIALGVVHPGAVGRVERQIDGADQRLALGEVGDRGLDQLEVGVGDEAAGPLAQHPLAVHASHGMVLLKSLLWTYQCGAARRLSSGTGRQKDGRAPEGPARSRIIENEARRRRTGGTGPRRGGVPPPPVHYAPAPGRFPAGTKRRRPERGPFAGR
jgi:hypothetical protein